MNDEDSEGDSFEAKLRRLAQQLGRSVEDLRELDVDVVARLAGVEPDRARELLEEARDWISSRADELVDEAMVRFRTSAFAGQAETTQSATGPHPRDLPTPEQGRALSAIDSGRWAIEPGSHAVTVPGGGPAPVDAVGLVGELRVRDWISASGELTMAGRKALARWLEGSDPEPK